MKSSGSGWLRLSSLLVFCLFEGLLWIITTSKQTFKGVVVMGAMGRVPLYHFSQPLDLDSVRIKNDWEVDVKTRHIVFHISLWPGKNRLGRYNIMADSSRWNKDTKHKDVPEILLNSSHFSLATFFPVLQEWSPQEWSPYQTKLKFHTLVALPRKTRELSPHPHQSTSTW